MLTSSSLALTSWEPSLQEQPVVDICQWMQSQHRQGRQIDRKTSLTSWRFDLSPTPDYVVSTEHDLREHLINRPWN
jgi:hypothetical protein